MTDAFPAMNEARIAALRRTLGEVYADIAAMDDDEQTALLARLWKSDGDSRDGVLYRILLHVRYAPDVRSDEVAA